MTFSELDLDALQEIVEREGNCLDAKLCSRCPFKSKCLPEFIKDSPPTKNQRMMLALDAITCSQLMDDDIDVDKYSDQIVNSKRSS